MSWVRPHEYGFVLCQYIRVERSMFRIVDVSATLCFMHDLCMWSATVISTTPTSQLRKHSVILPSKNIFKIFLMQSFCLVFVLLELAWSFWVSTEFVCRLAIEFDSLHFVVYLCRETELIRLSRKFATIVKERRCLFSKITYLLWTSIAI